MQHKWEDEAMQAPGFLSQSPLKEKFTAETANELISGFRF
jgi:hypothetical protein